jgi:hypothetical protein
MTETTKQPPAETRIPHPDGVGWCTPRKAFEVTDPDGARKQAFQTLSEGNADDAELKKLVRERESAQAAYHEWMKPKRRLEAAALAVVQKQNQNEHKRQRAEAVLRRTANPLIREAWLAIDKLWNEQRQKASGKRAREALQVLVDSRNELSNMHLRPGDPLPRIKALCKLCGVQMPTLPEPIVRTKLEVNEDE